MDTNGITVGGHGEVALSPDRATLNVGIHVSESTVAAARDRAAAAAVALHAAIKDQGIDAAHIRTSQLSVGPRYDYSREGQQRLLGYDVSNMVSITVEELATLAAVVDAALAAAGDAVRLNGLEFDVRDPRDAASRARELAMADAAAKARQLAQLAGVSLGAPTAIMEGHPAAPPPMLRGMAMAMEAKQSTPIEAGSTVISCEVTVTYAIAESAGG